MPLAASPKRIPKKLGKRRKFCVFGPNGESVRCFAKKKIATDLRKELGTGYKVRKK